MRMVKLLLILAVIVLSGCQNKPNAETAMLAACQEYFDVLTTLEPFAPKMSPVQMQVIRESLTYAGPLCSGDAVITTPDGQVNYQAMVDLIRAKLRALVMVQNQVQK